MKYFIMTVVRHGYNAEYVVGVGVDVSVFNESYSRSAFAE